MAKIIDNIVFLMHFFVIFPLSETMHHHPGTERLFFIGMPSGDKNIHGTIRVTLFFWVNINFPVTLNIVNLKLPFGRREDPYPYPAYSRGNNFYYDLCDERICPVFHPLILRAC